MNQLFKSTVMDRGAPTMTVISFPEIRQYPCYGKVNGRGGGDLS